ALCGPDCSGRPGQVRRLAPGAGPSGLRKPGNRACLTMIDLLNEVRALSVGCAVILGSGMSKVATRGRPRCRLPFAEVPGLAASTIPGHCNYVSLSEWSGTPVLMFEGRLHHYE